MSRDLSSTPLFSTTRAVPQQIIDLDDTAEALPTNTQTGNMPQSMGSIPVTLPPQNTLPQAPTLSAISAALPPTSGNRPLDPSRVQPMSPPATLPPRTQPLTQPPMSVPQSPFSSVATLPPRQELLASPQATLPPSEFPPVQPFAAAAPVAGRSGGDGMPLDPSRIISASMLKTAFPTQAPKQEPQAQPPTASIPAPQEQPKPIPSVLAPPSAVPRQRPPAWNPAAEAAARAAAEPSFEEDPEDPATVDWPAEDLSPPTKWSPAIATLPHGGSAAAKDFDGIWPPEVRPAPTQEEPPVDEENPPVVDWDAVPGYEPTTVPLTWPEWIERPQAPPGPVVEEKKDLFKDKGPNKPTNRKTDEELEKGAGYVTYNAEAIGYKPPPPKPRKDLGDFEEHGQHIHPHVESFCEKIGNMIKRCTGTSGKGMETDFEKDNEELEAELENGLGPDGPIFFFGGIFVVSMLVMIPVWDGITLGHDPVWHWMYGQTIPLCLLAFLLVPILFAFTVLLLLNFGHQPGQSNKQQAMHVSIKGHVSSVFILFLGVGLVLIGKPIEDKAFEAHNAFWNECWENEKTSPLYDEYQQLRALRDSPACQNMPSVEHCAGYTPTDESAALKQFEMYFHCSGFCYHPPSHTKDKVVFRSVLVHVVSPLMKKMTIEKRLGQLGHSVDKLKKQLASFATGSEKWKRLKMRIQFLADQKKHYGDMLGSMSNSNQFGSLIQTDQNQEVQEGVDMARALESFENSLEEMDTSSLEAELSKVKALVENNETQTSVEAITDTSAWLTNITVDDEYPTTLFHDSQYYGSCSSMAGTDMHSYVHDIGLQLMCEGIFLMGVAVASGFILIFGMIKGATVKTLNTNGTKKVLGQLPQETGYGTINGTTQTMGPSNAGFRGA